MEGENGFFFKMPLSLVNALISTLTYADRSVRQVLQSDELLPFVVGIFTLWLIVAL